MQYKWTALTVTSVGNIMAGLDIRILVIGLPTVASQLHTGPEEVIWISQSYLLASTVSLLLFGRIADLFGRVKLYNIGFVIFTAGSGLSAISSNSYELIGFRAIQGIGAALLNSSSAAIITDAAPKQQLGLMLGLGQTAFRAGSIAGLTLSGLILSFVNWRGLFYVNVPIGFFGTVWSYIKLREIATKDVSKKIDWKGFVLFCIGLTLTLLSITFLSYGTAGLAEGIALLIAGLALIIIFVRIESSESSPMLDLKLFKNRLFAAANVAQLVSTISWTGLLLLVAFYLQIGLGYSPLVAGLGIIPVEIVYFFSAIINGRLSDKYGSRFLSTSGLVLLVICNLILSTFGASTPYSEIAVILAFYGFGVGMFNTPNFSAIMGSVPANRRGIASGFRQTMFNIGSTVSYGFVILFMTFGIPYTTLNPLLQNIEPQTVIAAAKSQFFDGFRIAALLLAAMNAIAIFPSAMRGKKESEPTQAENKN
ncbi:MAG: MFS transporter [Nitrososphaerales archaeon]